MLGESNGFEDNLPLHVAVQSGSKNLSDIEFLFSLYENCYTEAEIAEFFKLKVEDKSDYRQGINIFRLRQSTRVLRFLSQKLKMRSKTDHFYYEIWQLIESQYTTKEEFTKIWLQMEAELNFEEIMNIMKKADQKNSNLLQLAAQCLRNHEILEFWWQKITRNFDTDEKLKEFLLLKLGKYETRVFLLISIKVYDGLFFTLLFEKLFNKILILKDLIGTRYENFFVTLASSSSLAMIKLVLDHFQAHLTPQDFRKCLTVRDRHGKSFISKAMGRDSVICDFVLSSIENIMSKHELREFYINIISDGDIVMFKKITRFMKSQFTRHEIRKILKLINFNRKRSKSMNVLHHLIVGSKENLTGFLIAWIKRACSKQYVKVLLSERDSNDELPLHYILSNTQSLLFCYVWSFYERNFSSSDMIEMLELTKPASGVNILLLALGRNRESFKFLINWIKKHCETSDVKSILCKEDTNLCLLLHHACKIKNVEYFKIVFEFYITNFTKEEIQRMLESKGSDGGFVLNFKDYREDLKDKLQIYSPFMFYRFELWSLIKDEDMDEDFVKVWNEMETKLTKKEILQIALQKDEKDENFLHHALNSCAKSRFIWNKIKDLFTDDDRKSLLLYKSNKYGSSGNVLLASFEHDNATFYFLFEEVFCEYFKIKEFICETNGKGQHLMHKIAEKMSVSTFKLASRQLFQSHESISGNYANTFVRILKIIELNCEEDDMRKLLKNTDRLNLTPIDYAFRNECFDVLKIFYAIYDKFFNKTENKKLHINRSIPWEAKYRKREEKYEFLSSILEIKKFKNF